MTDLNPENEFSAGLEPEAAGDLVYALAGAPGLLPGVQGLALAGRASGLIHSLDGGRTWQDSLAGLALSDPLPVLALALSPSADQPGVLLAGAPGGVFRSTDAGQNWQAVLLPQPPPTVSALASAPRANQDPVFFAGTMEDGVFISEDAGAHWSAWNFGLLDLNVMCLACSTGFARDETLFAGTETGLFRSTNGSRAWRELEMPFGFDAVISLAVSPNFAADHSLYAGTEAHGLWLSADGGESWQPQGSFEDPINAILASAGGLLVVTSDGLWQAPGAGADWINRLPEQYASREVTTALAPQGVNPGTPVLVGFVDGGVEVIHLEK